MTRVTGMLILLLGVCLSQSQFIQMEDGKVTRNSLSENAYFMLNVTVGEGVRFVAFQLSFATRQDVMLYIKRGEVPSRDYYDDAIYGASTEAGWRAVLPVPGPGNYTYYTFALRFQNVEFEYVGATVGTIALGDTQSFSLDYAGRAIVFAAYNASLLPVGVSKLMAYSDVPTDMLAARVLRSRSTSYMGIVCTDETVNRQLAYIAVRVLFGGAAPLANVTLSLTAVPPVVEGALVVGSWADYYLSTPLFPIAIAPHTTLSALVLVTGQSTFIGAIISASCPAAMMNTTTATFRDAGAAGVAVPWTNDELAFETVFVAILPDALGNATAGGFTLSVSAPLSCNDGKGCGQNGLCTASGCSCVRGFTGADCSEVNTELVTSITTTWLAGTIQPAWSEWNRPLFMFTAPTEGHMWVTLNAPSSTLMVIGKGYAPTLRGSYVQPLYGTRYDAVVLRNGIQRVCSHYSAGTWFAAFGPTQANGTFNITVTGHAITDPVVRLGQVQTGNLTHEGDRYSICVPPTGSLRKQYAMIIDPCNLVNVCVLRVRETTCILMPGRFNFGLESSLVDVTITTGSINDDVGTYEMWPAAVGEWPYGVVETPVEATLEHRGAEQVLSVVVKPSDLTPAGAQVQSFYGDPTVVNFRTPCGIRQGTPVGPAVPALPVTSINETVGITSAVSVGAIIFVGELGSSPLTNPVQPKDLTPNPPAPPTTAPPHGPADDIAGKLGAGGIAGIAVGGAAVLGLGGFGVYRLRRRRQPDYLPISDKNAPRLTPYRQAA